MLIRIVKMGFHEEYVSTFIVNFNENKERIRNFEGCHFLELYRDRQNNNVFFTYSYWENETSLENYRHSELFNTVWAKTKPLFNMKPEAWSVDKIASIK